MKKIADILRESKCPLMVYINKAETASTQDVITNAFKDKKHGFTFVTNVAEPKSLAGGDAPVKIAGVEQKIEVSSLTNDDTVSHMVDSEGNHVYLDVELAFDLNKDATFFSPLTGNEVTLAYFEQADEDTGMEGEDESEEEETTSEEESESEGGEEESETEEDTIETVSSVEDIAAEGDGEEEDDSLESEEEDETTTEDEDESEVEEMAEDEPTEVNAAVVADSEVEVSMLDMAEEGKAIRLIAIASDHSEIAVFVGGIPVGKLTASKAAETASFLYENDKKLFHTFKDRYAHAAKTGNFGELASLGFEPYVASVKVSALVEKYIAQETASIREEIAAERNTGTERQKRVLSLAMVGMLKGLHEKGTNALVREVSSLLRQAGHTSPDLTARRALAKASGEFTKAVFERADALAKEDDAYLNGISDTVAAAEFKAGEGETVDPSKVTTLFGGKSSEQTESASEGFHSPHRRSDENTNRFAKVVTGIGQRSNFGRR